MAPKHEHGSAKEELTSYDHSLMWLPFQQYQEDALNFELLNLHIVLADPKRSRLLKIKQIIIMQNIKNKTYRNLQIPDYL